MVNEQFDYIPFLKKAYFDPIRTVTVIDDEYPTLEKLISATGDTISKYDVKNVERLQEVVKHCKDPANNWMLDVYDGDEGVIESNTVVNRLHHSDLLILDYHLDGEDFGICHKTLKLLQYLADNKHFNLVAIHTKGYTGSTNKVADVFRDVVVALQQKPIVSSYPQKKVDDALDDWEVDDDTIRDKLIQSISDLQLLELLKDNSVNDLAKGMYSTHQYLGDFEELYSNMPSDVKLPKALLIKWLCATKLKEYDAYFCEKSFEHFDWAIEGNETWLKTDDLFITVLGKSDTPVHKIPDQVLKALSKWTPHPHKLILAKLRFEIEKHGISAAQNILNQKHLQAAWLSELMDIENTAVLKTTTWNTVYKLWEQLAYEIKQNVSEFALDLITYMKSTGGSSEVLSRFVDDNVVHERNKQIYHANCFSCSKDLESYHLTTGHILEFEKGFWLCLTPVCDLVPGQKDEGSLISATMVKLQDAKEAWKLTRKSMADSLKVDESKLPTFTDEQITDEIVKLSTSNNLIYLKVDNNKDNIKCFSFTAGIDGKAAPKASEFLIGNQGVFLPEDRSLTVYKSSTEKAGKPEYKEINATVVSELRYEYALNLLGRLGFSRSRVGLDFISS